MNADKQLMAELTKELTYKIDVIRSKNGTYNTVETIRHYSIPSPGVIAIPSGRMDLIPEDFDIVDRRINFECMLPYPLIHLRTDPGGQQDVLDAWEGSGILNAMVGWGKSFTALWIAFKLGQKTLVVTHNTMLRDQWIKDVRVLFGIEPGIVGSGEFDINSPIVIGNVQTLTKLSEPLANTFGTLIVDECHHTPATTFTNIVAASKARYKIGLSGTVERKDGKHILFKDFFGPVIIKPPQSNTLTPKIKIIKSGRKLNPTSTWPMKINELMEDYQYQEFIAAIAITLIDKGRKVLIVADRVAFLERVNRLIGDRSILITGSTADFAAREKAKKQIETDEKWSICGSKQIFAEGISINILDTIILTCPTGNAQLLEQLIGRIQREYPGKEDCWAIDINFLGRAEKVTNNARLMFYAGKGWEVQVV